MKQLLGVQHWINDEDFLTRAYRLASQPTVYIEGLVSGYTGPGGKTVLPGRAEAKLDFRRVPDMTKEEAVAKLQAHLARRGFSDIEVIVSGGYSPTQSPEDSAVVKSAAATLTRVGIEHSLFPRRAGSWPGVVFTGPPLNMVAGHFGVGRDVRRFPVRGCARGRKRSATLTGEEPGSGTRWYRAQIANETRWQVAS